MDQIREYSKNKIVVENHLNWNLLNPIETKHEAILGKTITSSY